MHIITSPTELDTHSIRVQTRKANDIQNEQSLLISEFERSQFPIFIKKHPKAKLRALPTGIYNCHGLTFASRRTMIYDPNEIWKIIKDDNYVRVEQIQALPGDVVLYLSVEGDVEHSGIVISEPEPNFYLPKVWSKWGKYYEVIHYVNDCPYEKSNIQYYRIMG
ncbi:hypothetical protein L0337_24425 [candidate division KSB1 bacterium]|nr:hypothetical protein [candidate division KSB1 bacterium]